MINDRRTLYAHSLPDSPAERWEPLDRHLLEVAELASGFATEFGAAEWGWIAGRCHDLGKASAEFQDYISRARDAADAGEERRSNQRVNHSTFGSRYVAEKLPGPVGRMLAFCIAGHHAGLPDGHPDSDARASSTLEERLKPDQPIPHVEDPQIPLATPKMKQLHCTNAQERAFSLAFFTRMLFSGLVDADRLCTEAFCDSGKAKERQRTRPTLPELRNELDRYLDRKQQQARPTLVNQQRREILRQCVEAAAGPSGFYSLQVPTGGGKTLSSLAFALHHAGSSMRRVVVAIPFTSIIEQTADVYREALGQYADAALVEHHTNIQPERDTRANQMASENWDAPLVVTTNVQLLESLFAASTRACRKLHRLANSVIVLDEAQTLPVDLLEPTLRALRELVSNYGCTVVLCTATQPALTYREDFRIGIRDVRPIIAAPAALFAGLRRVEVQHAGRLTNEELAGRLAAEKRVLCIVHTKRHAEELFRRTQDQCEPGSVFHLSTLMCGAHRLAALKQIRERLKPGTGVELATRVVSTSLIEAGVDLDVPVVYRGAAGFDSIAQAAGRCNREGLLERGLTYVFDSEDAPPRGLQLEGANMARELWDMYPDPLAPDAVEHYFRGVYWKRLDGWDHCKVMECMRLGTKSTDLHLQFRSMEERYKLIREDQVPVLVPYNDEARFLIAQLQSPWIDFVPHRQLQPYLVSVPRIVADRLSRDAVLEEHASGVRILLREDVYTQETGLDLDKAGVDDRVLIV